MTKLRIAIHDAIHQSRIKNKLALLFATMAIPGIGFAQQQTNQQTEEEAGDNLEEIVVTGSFIPRTKFESATPVEIITAEDIQTYGVAGLGEFIKDLTFMNGINLENDPGNFAAGGDLSIGRPDGVKEGFDLRGFGTGGTLTLIDGQRTSIGNADANVVPNIALSRVEIALDGAGAAYGSDAIAGVVNIITLREYDGFKFNTYYQRDDGGDFEETKIEMLTGYSIFGWNFVSTLEATQRSRLALLERPEYARAAQTTSSRGAPGAYFDITTGFTRARYLDPGCGSELVPTSFDPGDPNFLITGAPDRNGANPFRPTCYFPVDVYSDILPKRDRYQFTNNGTWEINDYMEFRLDANWGWTEGFNRNYPPVNITTGSGDGAISFPKDHPAFQVEPFLSLTGPFIGTGIAWRPFGRFGNLPPGTNGDGSHNEEEETYRQRYSARLLSQLGDSGWDNTTELNYSKSRVTNHEYALLEDRLQAAASGMGGPNGDLWFNPLLSSATDPALANSDELLNWMFQETEYNASLTYSQSIETRFTGELWELPAGPIRGAFGAQYREYELDTDQDEYALAGNRYEGGGGFNFEFETRSRSAYFELNFPLFSDLEVLGMNLGEGSVDVSGRKEWNYEREDTPLTPKYALRWSPTPDWAFRVSWSESALAPSENNVTLDPDPEAQEFMQTIDPFATANPDIPTLVGSGAIYKDNGNPDLKSARSETKNLGFTYRGIPNLTLSVDAQEINNYDRIETLSHAEILGRQFAQFEATGGDPANTAAVLAFFANTPNPQLTRDPATGAVLEMLLYPENLNERVSRTVDLSARYNIPTENWGTFTASGNATYIDSYKLILEDSLDGSFTQVVGQRNRDVSGASTLPRWRGNVRLGWIRGPHGINSTVNYTHHFDFDGSDVVTDFFNVGTRVPDVIHAHTRVDLSYSYEFDDFFGLGNGTVYLGSRDLFDNTAQIVPIRQGKVREQSLQGRSFWFQLAFEFDNSGG